MFRLFFKSHRVDDSELIPLLSDSDLVHEAGSTPADLAADNDLSYSDALLDLEVHTFFRREYSNAEPPDGVYARVLHSINNSSQLNTLPSLQVSRPGLSARFSSALTRALSGTTTARLVPGAVALMLMVAVLGPNTARFLSGSADLLHGGTFSTSISAGDQLSADFIEFKNSVADIAAPEATSIPQASAADEPVAYPLDPYEMGLPQRARVARAHAEEQDPGKDNSFISSRFGPQ